MYKVIRSTSITYFEETINEAIASGAKLIGGVFVIERRPDVLLWCQAVLYPPNK